MSARAVRYGTEAVLVDLPDLAAVRALDDALRAEPPAGVVDVVPAARTVLVRFRSAPAARAGVDAVLRAAQRPAPAPAGGTSEGETTDTAPHPASPVPEPATVVLPVRYDGADLAEAARLTGLDVAEVVRRHAAATYTVGFVGFMPGFAYLTGLDPALRVPRRSSPRERVPAGSVAIAGELAAVYPAATPGGWMLLGACDVPLFDVRRDPPALLTPGTRVRFVDVDEVHPSTESSTPPTTATPATPATPPAPPATPTPPTPATSATPSTPPTPPARLAPSTPPARTVEVLAPGTLALVQDRGRPGLAAVGVGRSGAADAGAARLANRLVGNAGGAAVIEVLLGGVELRFPQGGVVALTGAEVPAWVDGVPVPPHAATAVGPGGTLRTGPAVRGLRLYVGVRGGVDVPAVLGSRSTDQLSGIGPQPLRAGDVLPIGTEVQDAAQPWPDPPRAWADPAVLHVLPGPRPDWFDPNALDALCRTPYAVTPASNRVAVRLDGPRVRRPDRGELPSEPLVPGAVQVPPDGRPVVFGADHPVTGGYPVLAVLDARSRDAAAQLRPGDRVVFRPS